MQHPALLVLALLAGCATPHTPSPAPTREPGKPVRLSVVPSSTTKSGSITAFRGTGCQTNDRMPNAASASVPSTARIPRSESTGTPAPMPNVCPVTARTGTNAKVVNFEADSAAPRTPR